MRLAKCLWGGPSSDDLLSLWLTCSPQEQAALEGEVARRAATLPDPPPAVEVDTAAFDEVRQAVVKAKDDLAAAKGLAAGYASDIRAGTPRAAAGGAAALLDARDQAQEEARRLKRRYDELVQMEQKARVELGQRRQDASTAATKVYRDQLAGLLRQLDAKLAQVMLHDVLPAALAIRVRLEELSLG
jgi:hypothetical protein